MDICYVLFIFVVNDNCLATKMKKNSILLSVLICLSLLDIKAQTVDYSVVAVPEEGRQPVCKDYFGCRLCLYADSEAFGSESQLVLK